MEQQKILIATTNRGKFHEMKTFLDDLPFEFISLDDLKHKPKEPEENEGTIEGNAALKAKYYAEKTGYIALADDGGLFIDILNGWPGVISARVGETDEERRSHVLEKVKNLPDEQCSASFRLALALYDPHNKSQFLCLGERVGKILKEGRKGPSAWGYNEIFYLEDLKKTYGELTPEEKNATSHRGKALQKTKYFLQNNYGAKHIVVALPIVINKGQMLITLRNDPHRPEVHKKWEFPGGIIDFGETGESTSIKEVKEEAGYEVDVIKQLSKISIKDHQFPHFRYQVYLIPYVCKLIGGDGRFSKTEVLDAKWIDLETHRDYDFLDGDNDFLDEIMPELKEIIKIHNL
ncbi:MAG TPA: hypothetical protein DCS29_04455 [Candidatus Magasanikbacteria bacterium]|nr:MAG: hypothetical protein A2479_03510 [Candidatus Magasanikbacteria bacterium RIFOXYC2_FULL_39_8]HAT03992.1 hypothetical protein [Candidatus Magasanikbacteria bacterium]